MIKLSLRFLCAIAFLVFQQSVSRADSFVQVKQHQFFLNKKPYYFIGANYWYGSTLALGKDKKRGLERLRKELDFLRSQGVTNLRVLGAVEGAGLINGVKRVAPALQPRRGQFDPQVLQGLDLLLREMGRRKMKAVLYLSNNWEWSGGFQQYAIWNNLVAPDLHTRKLNWDELRDIVSRFYGSLNCRADYLRQVAFILGRRNVYTGKRYVDDSAIMAWELANEPRPMRPAANQAYLSWISEAASLIKSKDKKHLVTVGSEGDMGTEGLPLFEASHADKNIDYLTIHIWPKNWGWLRRNGQDENSSDVSQRAVDYLTKHLPTAQKLGKPLVIEEFGLPRDGGSFDPKSSVTARDALYRALFTQWKESTASNGVIAGCNFWSFSGTARPIPGQIYWKSGDALMGDPPMEEQGLNSVFDGDTTTWQLIRSFTKNQKQG